MNAQKQKGFTIIEVVLVLAIAALIFLMVFIALPALQANQRDTQRKADASLAASAITNYTSGERKNFTSTTTASALQKYLNSGELGYYEEAGLQVAAIGATPTADQILAYPKARCNGSVADDKNADGSPANDRTAAVVVLLDNGQNTYCVDAS